MMGKVTKYAGILLLCFLMKRSYAQMPDTGIPDDIFTLDSFMVDAVENGFSVDSLIQLMQNDTSFYAAFQNLRRIPYTGSATVRMFDEEHYVQALYTNRMEQYVDGKCRWMDFPFEISTGDFFEEDGDMHYTTASIFSYIFLYRDTICGKIVTTDNNAGQDAQLENRKEQLKTLIFNPGREVDGIPLIGDKMEIFSPEMQQYYDYAISRERYATGVDCIVFSVTKKATAEKGKDVVINELTTWFDETNMQIVARNYKLSYFTRLFDFDVDMQVRMGTANGYLIPTNISYNGYWDIPFQKPEIGSIQIRVE